MQTRQRPRPTMLRRFQAPERDAQAPSAPIVNPPPATMMPPPPILEKIRMHESAVLTDVKEVIAQMNESEFDPDLFNRFLANICKYIASLLLAKRDPFTTEDLNLFKEIEDGSTFMAAPRGLFPAKVDEITKGILRLRGPGSLPESYGAPRLSEEFVKSLIIALKTMFDDNGEENPSDGEISRYWDALRARVKAEKSAAQAQGAPIPRFGKAQSAEEIIRLEGDVDNAMKAYGDEMTLIDSGKGFIPAKSRDFGLSVGLSDFLRSLLKYVWGLLFFQKYALTDKQMRVANAIESGRFFNKYRDGKIPKMIESLRSTVYIDPMKIWRPLDPKFIGELTEYLDSGIEDIDDIKDDVLTVANLERGRTRQDLGVPSAPLVKEPKAAEPTIETMPRPAPKIQQPPLPPALKNISDNMVELNAVMNDILLKKGAFAGEKLAYVEKLEAVFREKRMELFAAFREDVRRYEVLAKYREFVREIGLAVYDLTNGFMSDAEKKLTEEAIKDRIPKVNAVRDMLVAISAGVLAMFGKTPATGNAKATDPRVRMIYDKAVELEKDADTNAESYCAKFADYVSMIPAGFEM